MTLEEFYKATEGMPKDAEVWVPLFGYEPRWEKAVEVELDEANNHIMIC